MGRRRHLQHSNRTATRILFAVTDRRRRQTALQRRPREDEILRPFKVGTRLAFAVRSAYRSALEALTILFQAAGLLAVATGRVHPFFGSDFTLKCPRITFLCQTDGLLSDRARVLAIAALVTIAATAVTQSVEAVTISIL